MPRAPLLSDWMGLAALTALWGSAFMLNEIILAALPPAVLVSARVFIAAAVLTIFLVIRSKQLPAPGSQWRPMAVMALFGTALPFQLIAWGQQHIASAEAGILMAVMPLFILTLAHFFVPGSRLTGYRIAGFAVGFGGVILVLGAPSLSGVATRSGLLGGLAVLAAALSYSFNVIYARRCGSSDPIALSAGTMLAACALTLPGALWQFPEVSGAPTVAVVAALAALGILATGVATVIYFRMIQGPGPAFLSLVNYLVPAWAVMAGALVLGESPAPAVYVGLGLILTGVGLSELGPALVSKLVATLRRCAPSQPAASSQDAA